ncbi:MATE family efflux transporter [Celeribacter indicus]|uniref:Efflux transporter inner membrane protein n=1 Tax=Celeribacter indicus TaxID=1208324 RepID=A0A0B5E8S0_9RHOB|nr:MATE family efflux transporter [Celeribacter indicus]AJE48697.1 efflux transporter inner membrane protein [Celeribacter indicus]SDX12697.1 putative efflux protein, MATE family [Celeribacter indicus]
MTAPDLSDPNLPNLMLRLGLPAMAGLSLNAAHQVVDAGFVGQLGAAPLAVLALLAPFAGLVASLGVGLGIGAASTVARALGAERPERARQIAGLGFCVAGLLAIGLWVVLQALCLPVLHLLGTPEESLSLARGYFPVLTLTLSFGLLQILCDFLAIGRGEARVSLRTLALCFGLNMALDPLFIFTFGLGLEGAAWATLTAQIVTLGIWALWFLAPDRRPEIGRLALLGPILRVGLPEAAALAVTTCGFIAVLRLSAGLDGVEAVAGLGLALRLLFLMILPLEGFAIGVQPVLAHAHGAGDAPRVARVQGLLILGALCVGGLAAALLWLGAAPVCGLLSEDIRVRAEAVAALHWLALAVPAVALRLVVQIGLQAAIRPRLALVLGLAPMGWLLWPALALLVPRRGLNALPMAITLAACLSAVLALALLRHGRLSPDAMGVSA